MARRFRRFRCTTCGLHAADCACALLRPIACKTPVGIVQHIREAGKATNTVRLLRRVLPGLEVQTVGAAPGQRFDPTVWQARPFNWYVVFPADVKWAGQGKPAVAAQEDAGELGGAGATPEAIDRRPALIFLDGTWRQCSRLRRRLDWVGCLPTLALPPSKQSTWVVRRPPAPGRLSTFEAVIDALALVEPTIDTSSQRSAFRQINARFARLRGRLRPELLDL